MTTGTTGAVITELTDGVFARLHDGLTNAGIIIGDEGVLIIDSLRVPSFARDLIADVRRLSDKPVRYVIDTHSHWDHSWGNEEFPDALIVGHVNCRNEMLDLDNVGRWRERVAGQGAPWSEEVKTVRVTPPALTFSDALQLHFGTHSLELRWLGRAHTSGDIFIHLPEEQLLFTGDVAQDRGVPYVLDGYIKDWVNTNERLLELEADRFVSGHGPVGARAALFGARDFVAELARGTEQAIAEGRDEAATRELVTAQLSARFADWRGLERVDESVGYAYRQLRGS